MQYAAVLLVIDDANHHKLVCPARASLPARAVWLETCPDFRPSVGRSQDGETKFDQTLCRALPTYI